MWTDVGAPLVFSGGTEGVGTGVGVTGAFSTDSVGGSALVGAGADVAVGAEVTVGAVVAVGVGADSAQAGAIVTAGSDAREMTSVASSAVVFRIEFTF